MKNLFAVTALVASMTLTGCASMSAPYEYQESHSEAYNIARAGGLVQDIEDTEVPANKLGSITESMANVGFVSAGYMKPQLGMTSWQTVGVNALSILSEPDSHGARNSMMAWMPMEEAKSQQAAQEEFLSHVKVAVADALNDMGATHETIYDRKGTVVVHFINNDWDCPAYEKGVTDLEDLCQVRFQVYEPRTAPAPSFITQTNTGEERYVFSSGHGRKYHRLNLLVNDNSSVPESELYANISKGMPDWSYLYLAPGKVKTGEGKTIEYPYILNQGKAELFLIPKS
ncbi:hypothetical protein LWH94_09890 [Marinobacter sp. G11]|uniref:hypothetical protein n=1 Tax=Marinobacter sp. G11 TaxID=2903522 RepID=UPI001E293C24|nr:hypothetical protein [Marinobacter sp. G11]MCE0759514.1 hypothetical protein [Marinobacter sp. G11]